MLKAIFLDFNETLCDTLSAEVVHVGDNLVANVTGKTTEALLSSGSNTNKQ
jgi:hypothetical protein